MGTLEPSAAVWITIAGAAFVTYALRFGGLLLSEKLPRSGRFKIFMDALPGTILLSLVAPGILSAGWWGCIAALSTAVCAWKTRNVFLAMLIGMGIVAAARHLAV
ncbi:MAG: AzlD family protein [Desulfobacterales bacterium]